jgi:hypothetical protein
MILKNKFLEGNRDMDRKSRWIGLCIQLGKANQYKGEAPSILRKRFNKQIIDVLIGKSKISVHQT